MMKILVATDGSSFGKAAVQKMADILANTPDTQVKILSIYEKLGPMAGEPFGVSIEYYREAENSARKLAVEAVEEAVAELQARFTDLKFVITTAVERGRAARVIVEVAAEWPADLIVIGSHGYGFWERNLLGSVSDAVVHHAPCSVVVVRSAAESV